MRLSVFYSSVLLLVSTTLPAAPTVAAVPAALTLCQSCHQPDGSGNAALQAPALAAQQQDYLLRQLQHFQSGLRGAHPQDAVGAQMRAALPTDLSAEDLTALAGHFAALPAPAKATQAADAVQVDKGRRIYINSCGACHGAKAEGVVALKAPSLRQLDAVYLQRQLEYFRTGVRGSDKNDKPGRQMAMMARTLQSEQDVAQVIAYIGSLP
ncbi:MAG: c-type cytochrome [Rheinheimera sp.]|nr:MAG: c-type cytochrome [Rheinheimera sp.]